MPPGSTRPAPPPGAHPEGSQKQGSLSKTLRLASIRWPSVTILERGLTWSKGSTMPKPESRKSIKSSLTSTKLMLVHLMLNGRTERVPPTRPTGTTPPFPTGEDRPKHGGCLPPVTSSAPVVPSAPTQTRSVRNRPTASAGTALLPSPTKTAAVAPNNLPRTRRKLRVRHTIITMIVTGTSTPGFSRPLMDTTAHSPPTPTLVGTTLPRPLLLHRGARQSQGRLLDDVELPNCRLVAAVLPGKRDQFTRRAVVSPYSITTMPSLVPRLYMYSPNEKAAQGWSLGTRLTTHV